MNELKGKSVCMYSPKGGVGKTILLANIGAIASLNNKKVLLIDFDLFNGTLSMFINEEINKTIYNLTDDLNNNRYKKINDYVYKYNENIDILCAPKDPRQGNKIDSKYIDIILERAANIYDLILIDTYPNLDDISITTLDFADEILFIINNDMFTIKNMKNIINIFEDNGIKNYKVLLNNSNDLKTQYFSILEIKKIIDTNIDYTISKNFYMKDITSYIYNSKIPMLENNNYKKYKDDVHNIEVLLKDILGGAKDEKE